VNTKANAMSVTITLRPEDEERFRADAAREGVNLEQLAIRPIPGP